MRPNRLHLRCTDAELDAWRHAAERDGRTLSDWIRRQLNVGLRTATGPEGPVPDDDRATRNRARPYTTSGERC